MLRRGQLRPPRAARKIAVRRGQAVLVPCRRRSDRDNPELFRYFQNFIGASGEKKNLLDFFAVSLNKLKM
jgi:hypothetical protein